jgi:hypothetical protein
MILSFRFDKTIVWSESTSNFECALIYQKGEPKMNLTFATDLERYGKSKTKLKIANLASTSF